MPRPIMFVEIDALRPGARTFATYNPSDRDAQIALSGGNLVAACNTAAYRSVRSTISYTSGRRYAEFQSTTHVADRMTVGVAESKHDLAVACGLDAGYGLRSNHATVLSQAVGVTAATGLAALTAGQWSMVAVDFDAGRVWLGNNGVWANSGNPETGASPTYTFAPGLELFLMASVFGTTQTVTLNAGATPFVHAVPGGFMPWFTQAAGTTETLRYATEEWIDVDDVVWAGRLRSDVDPTFEQSVTCWPWSGGRAATVFGELRLANHDARLDGLSELIFRDRPIRIRHGDGDQALRFTDYALWGAGVLDRLERTVEDWLIVLADQTSRLDRALQTQVYDPTTNVVELRGLPRPMCIGAAKSVDPVVQHAGNRMYDFGDALMGGVELASDQGDPDVLNTDYRIKTRGFRRAVAAVGKISADVLGEVRLTSTFFTENFASWSAGVFDNDPAGWTVVGETGAGERVYEAVAGTCRFLKSGAFGVLRMERNLGLVAGTRYAIRFNVTAYVNGELRVFLRDAGGVASTELFRVDGTETGGVGFTVVPAAGQTWLRFEVPSGFVASVDIDNIEVSECVVVESVADSINWLLDRCGYSAGDRDAASITALSAAAPYTLAYFQRNQQNARDVMRMMLDSVCGWMYGTVDGRVAVGRLSEPSATPVLELGRNELDDDWVEQFDRAPGLSTSMGAQRNWTLHGDSDFTTILPQATREMLRAQFRIIRRVTGVIWSEYSHAESAPPFGTLLATAAAATAEVARVAWMYRQRRAFYSGSAVTRQAAVLSLRPGDTIRLTMPRNGFAAGRNVVVVGIKRSWRSRRVRLTVWG